MNKSCKEVIPTYMDLILYCEPFPSSSLNDSIILDALLDTSSVDSLCIAETQKTDINSDNNNVSNTSKYFQILPKKTNFMNSVMILVRNVSRKKRMYVKEIIAKNQQPKAKKDPQ